MHNFLHALITNLKSTGILCAIYVLCFGIMITTATTVIAQNQISQKPSSILILELLPAERMSGLYEIEIPTTSSINSLITIFPYDSEDEPVVRPMRCKWLSGSISENKIVMLYSLETWPRNMFVELSTNTLPIKMSNDSRKIELDFDFQSILSRIPFNNSADIQTLEINEVAVIMPSIGIKNIYYESPEPSRIEGAKRIYLYDTILRNDGRITIEYLIDVGQTAIFGQTLVAFVVALLSGFATVVALTRLMSKLRLLATIILITLWLIAIALVTLYFRYPLPWNQFLPYVSSVIIYSIFWTFLRFPPKKLGELLLREE